MKYTEGPWEVRQAGGLKPSYAIAPKGMRPSGGCIAMIPHREGREHISKANARLIASAPELLEACKLAVSLLSEIREDEGGHKAMTDFSLKQAIAKAEGKT